METAAKIALCPRFVLRGDDNMKPVPAFTYLEKAGIFKDCPGDEWAVEVTFDGGRKTQKKDLRPDLPLILRY